MRKRYYLSLLLLGWITIASAYKLISPVHLSIIREDYVKLQVLIEEKDPIPDSVLFEYFERNLTKPYIWPSKTTVKADQYTSYLLNLKTFLDNKFYVRALIYSDTGIAIIDTTHSVLGNVFWLDRNPVINRQIIHCLYKSEKEDLRSLFSSCTSDSFTCNNNQIRFKNFWDQDSFYLVAHITDNYLNTFTIKYDQNPNLKNFIKRLWDSDGLEICFDLNHNKSEFKKLDDFEFIACLGNNFQGNTWDESLRIYKHWGQNARLQISVSGTINNNTDHDTGYMIIAAIPWNDMGYRPSANDTIGYDLQNFDRDNRKDYAFRIAWSGSVLENNDNTSEWGNMVFIPLRKPFGLRGWAGIAVMLILFLIVLIISRKKKITGNEEQLSSKVLQIKYFISEHYSDPYLTRNKLALEFGMNKNYLSTLFSQQTKKHLNYYINELRIEKAKLLLNESKMNIAEIAFQTGFSSPQSFNRTFKKITGFTPSEYRKK
jgi:AraC-like DNA-binding protein